VISFLGSAPIEEERKVFLFYMGRQMQEQGKISMFSAQKREGR
jgi:hypothetical protein